jgi:hypothetical protein
MANTLFNDTATSIQVNVGQTGQIAGNQFGANAITLSTSATGKETLASLNDVNDLNLVDGGTLVYNAEANEYILKNPDLDGGSF